MPYIFISYAKKDTKSLAIDLADKLNSLEGFSAWVDVEGIDYGDEWETLIQRQIARCDYMVVLYSPDINRHIDDESQTESYVIKEIRYAQMRKKLIIPVMAQETEPPMSLISIQYIDYANEGISSLELVNRLCKRMKITPTPKSDAVSVNSSKPQIDIPPKPKIILPQPFDWCYISAGKVTLTTDAYHKNIYITHDKEVDVSAFWMAKYPITNGQYAQFLQYESNYFRPQMWDDKSHNNYPVVGVTWRNAMDFCLWLSRITGFHVTLPTDEQWQRAAQGDTNSVYPWGNEFTPDGVIRSNTSEAGNGKIMPVNQYPAGASYFDVMDMAGNVWEYCLTHYTSGRTDGDDDKRILRGGSYDADKSWCRNTFRIPRDTKELWNKGFRIVCSIS